MDKTWMVFARHLDLWLHTAADAIQSVLRERYDATHTVARLTHWEELPRIEHPDIGPYRDELKDPSRCRLVALVVPERRTLIAFGHELASTNWWSRAEIVVVDCRPKHIAPVIQLADLFARWPAAWWPPMDVFHIHADALATKLIEKPAPGVRAGTNQGTFRQSFK